MSLVYRMSQRQMHTKPDSLLCCWII